MAKPGTSSTGVDSETAKKKKKSKYAKSQKPTESLNVVAKPMPSMPISVIIQSLIKSLCEIYEGNDQQKSKELYTKICKMLFTTSIIDESFRMPEFEGIRDQCQRAIHDLLTSSRDNKIGVSPVWHKKEMTQYQREFIEIAYIGGGGFGKVFHVKHKLDETEYAVKKIFIKSPDIRGVQTTLAEAKTFASLNHPNIVQYKAAWLELGAEDTLEEPISDESETDDWFEQRPWRPRINGFSEHVDSPNKYPEQLSVVPVNRISADDNSDFQVSFENSHHILCYSSTGSNSLRNQRERLSIDKRHRSKRNSISEGGYAICTVEEIQNCVAEAASARMVHPKWATLYIQMALCQCTLKQWLEQRDLRNCTAAEKEYALVPVTKITGTKTIMEILRQLLKGIQYIHSKKIVHHDIKPSNIFLQMESDGSLLVQLGDFGLACPQSAKHPLAFGTALYAAPEQLAGDCNAMSDMYSLGIVLLELVETFHTDMERIETINRLRGGHLPPKLCTREPEVAAIVRQVVTRWPQDRPPAKVLLKMFEELNASNEPPRFPMKNDEIEESELVKRLQNQLAEKDEEINRLKELLKTFKEMKSV